jgi:hypothetical protein
MADLKYPKWQCQYKAVLSEFDPRRVRELIAATEETIFARFQALSRSPGGDDEREAIADAVNALYAIKQGHAQTARARNRPVEGNPSSALD